MTMQVAMIGTDGIVIASDTRASICPLQSGSGVRHHRDVPKIRIDPTEKIAIACAGDTCTAIQIADQIFNEWTNINSWNIEQKICEIGSKVANDHYAECLIAHNDLGLYLFQSGKNTHCTPIIGSAHAGDRINAATYWTTRYYTRLPVKKLMRLAAYVIVEASRLDGGNGGIHGLEMVYWTGEKYRRLSCAENRYWESKAKKWSEKIGRFVLG